MATGPVITDIELKSLPHVATGKVRSLYKIGDDKLLFVTSDRISAYDVVMKNGVPDKGALLTNLSVHWFKVLSEKVPGLKTHFLTTELPEGVTAEDSAMLRNRSMQVRKLEIFQIEAIVRGYLTGSGWKEYKAKGTVHGIKLPEGLRECDKIPGGPIFTPSTKAEQGQHDENIHPDQAKDIPGIGEKYAGRIADLAVKLFKAGQEYADARGIIIADTKFEFGSVMPCLDKETDEIVLVDEVLTSDSSRMWEKAKYEPGHDQDSFDKQYLRNWLTENGLKGKPGVEVPEAVIQATSERYKDVFQRITGKTLEETIKN